MQKYTKRCLSLLLAIIMIMTSFTTPVVFAAPEIVAGGYELDMENLPKVHFGVHKEWEELYNAAWEMHKSNIKKIGSAVNPNAPYYVDEAFDTTIFSWDTLFMMLFDKYGMNEFPTLESLDNFYYQQVDGNGPDRGFIPRRINESNANPSFGYADMKGTNPPLWAWAEWEQYMVHGDKNRFSEIIDGKTILQRLDDHFEFIKRNRTVSSTSLYKTTPDGNGTDNSPNGHYDNGYSWSGYSASTGTDLGQTFNDLSIQMYQFAWYIKEIADEVGNTALSAKYEAELETHRALLQQLWDEEDAFFYNLLADGKTFSKSVGTGGTWALSARLATPEQAAQMIEKHTLNSEGLFRPSGTASVAYRDPFFHPDGRYWRGGIWAPASYQYIKGLEYNGYDELAFQEALRHLNTLLKVYPNEYVNDGGTLAKNTIWECYSPDYTRPNLVGDYDIGNGGDYVRSNFVGWSGTLVIGTLIENIIGVTLNAPENEIDWNMHLTESNGISNLFMADNDITLMAEERLSAASPVSINVIAEKAFTLNVTNGEQRFSFDVQPGENTFVVGGKTVGEGGFLSGKTKTIAAATDILSADVTNADASVTFGIAADPSVNDSHMKNQSGKNDEKEIYNLNSIGVRSTVSIRPSELMREVLDDSNAMEYVQTGGVKPIGGPAYDPDYHGYFPARDIMTEDGFMVMAKADHTLKTLKLVLGVKNADAVLTASLSDASAPDYIRTLSGDAEEREYIVEIPFSAASDDRNHLMVCYRIMEAREDSEVSIKAVMLSDGGERYPMSPSGITLTAGNGKVTVDAKDAGQSAEESYKIYYGKNENALDQVLDAPALPVEINGLENNTRYYFAVSRIAGGAESEKSAPQIVTPRNPAEVYTPDIVVLCENQPNSVNLTEEGSTDWLLFDNGNANMSAVKSKNGGTAITDLAALPNGGTFANNESSAAKAVFSYSDGTPPAASGNTHAGTGFSLTGGVSFELPYSELRQQMNLYFGVYGAKVKLTADVLENDIKLGTITEVFESPATGDVPAEYRVHRLDYLLDNPTQTLKITMALDGLYDTRWGSFN
ncbi:MAG: hypothetical protein LBU77_02380, partial [Clostridiales bacterium]|nr:hypothetical protein [Clostridiales bacterium]